MYPGPTHLGPAWAHPLGPSLGPPTWARRGPTHLGPAWAHPLGPSLGPPIWISRRRLTNSQTSGPVQWYQESRIEALKQLEIKPLAHTLVQKFFGDMCEKSGGNYDMEQCRRDFGAEVCKIATGRPGWTFPAKVKYVPCCGAYCKSSTSQRILSFQRRSSTVSRHSLIASLLTSLIRLALMPQISTLTPPCTRINSTRNAAMHHSSPSHPSCNQQTSAPSPFARRHGCFSPPTWLWHHHRLGSALVC